MSYNFKDNLTIDNGKYLKWLDSTGTSRNNVLCVDSFNNTNIISPNGTVVLSDSSPSSSILVQSKLAIGISNTTNLSANLTISKGGIIGINTTRGSNNSYLTIAGSSSQFNTDGSKIVLYGNEAIGSSGNLNLYAGNVTNGNINLFTGNDNLRYQILNNGTSKFSPDGSATALLVEIDKTTVFNRTILVHNSNTIGNIITTGGNVGIGTNIPETTLDVIGTGKISTSLTTGALFSINQTTTNIVGTNISSATLNLGIGLTAGTIIATDTILAGTSISSANIIANLLTAGTAQVTNINNTAITSGTIRATTLVSSANISANLLTAGTLQNTNLVSTNITTTSLNLSIGLTSASAQITNANITTLTTGNLQNTNIVSTNISSGIINTNEITAGNINFTGSLYKNGSLYISSQWSSGSGGNLFYTSGNIGIGTSSPNYTLDVNGSGDFSTFVTSGALYSTNLTSTNIVGTIISSSNILVTTLTTGRLLNTNSISTNISSATLNLSTGLTSASVYITGGSFTATFNSNTIGNIITTGGNVGIGTSPTSQLHLNNGGGVNNYATIQLGNNNSSGWTIAKETDGFLGFYTGEFGSGVSRVGITSSGNLGIGTSTPTSKLSVWGAESSVDGKDAGIEIKNTASGSNNTWYLRAGASGTNTPAGGFSIGDGTDYRMTFTSTGNIGIGTASTNAKLHVRNSNAGFDFPTVQILRDLNTNDFSTAQHGFQLEIGKLTDNKRISMGVIDNGTGIFQAKEMGLGYSSLSLNPIAGNVGVGTATPSYRLDVAGSIRATSGDITLGNLLATNISNTAITSGTIRATTLVTAANIASNLITANNILSTNISTATLIVSNSTASTNSSTGSTIMFGGLSIRNSTDATSSTAGGALTIAGGASIRSTLQVGNMLEIGDISIEVAASFNGSNNVLTATNVTGLTFSTSEIRSFTITLAISVLKSTPNLFSQVVLEGIQKSGTWDLFSSEMGDDTGIVFSITSAGQIQYTSPNYVSWVSTTFRWSAKAISANGTYNPVVLPSSGSQTLTGPINITSSINATNSISGAITVAGGVGIARDLVVGGTIFGTIWTTSIQTTSFSVTASHKNFMFLASGSSIISLLPATTAGANFIVGFQKTDSVNTQIDIIPSSTLIDDYSNYILSTKNETIILISDGFNWKIMSTKTSIFASVYSIPGTYSFTVPNPIKTIYACVFGAGGGGGNGSGNSGNGGGGGGYCEGTISVLPGDTLTITVGEGGSPGIAGGLSSVSDLIATGGGPGGTNISGVWGSNGTPGIGTGGTVNRNGGTGGRSPSQTSGCGGGGGGAGNNGAGSDGNSTIGGAGSAGFGAPSTTTLTTDGSNVRVLNFYREGGSGASGNVEGTTTPGNNGGFPSGGGSGSGGATIAGYGGDGAVVIFY